MGAVAIGNTQANFLLLMPTNYYKLLKINFSGGSNNVTEYDQLETLDGIQGYDNSLTTLYAVLGSSDIYIHHITDTIITQTYSEMLVFA